MNRIRHCKRIVLAGSQGCRVLYCPDCEVAELEIGAVNMRLEEEVFRTLTGILNDAAQALASLQGAATLRPNLSRHVH